MTEAKKEAKKDMGIANSRELEKMAFETTVNIKQVKGKESGKWLTIITIGEQQDKTFLVTSRKDGSGTCLMTNWEEYQLELGVNRKLEKATI